MENKPEISIIIPVYKAELWLSRCLDSIQKQTFDNFEVILVDDASPDQSTDIAEKYTQKDKRFIIIHKEKNEGTMSARESGYLRAQSKYITFSDADDYFPENALQILYDKITRDNADIIFGGYTCVYENNSKKNIVRYIPSEISPNEVITLLLEHKLPNTLWGNIYSARLFRQYLPISFIGMTNAEDRMLLIQLISHAKKIGYTPLSIYFYWQNSQSNSRPRISERILKNIIFSNDWCYRYLLEIGINPGKIQSYHLYRTRYLLEIGYKIEEILAQTELDREIYTFDSVYSHINLPFAIHYLLLQKSKLYVYGYSNLKNLYHSLFKRL